MKQSELKELSLKDLQDKLQENKGIYTKMKLEHALTPLENPMMLKSIRKGIARIATEISRQSNQIN